MINGMNMEKFIIDNRRSDECEGYEYYKFIDIVTGIEFPIRVVLDKENDAIETIQLCGAFDLTVMHKPNKFTE